MIPVPMVPGMLYDEGSGEAFFFNLGRPTELHQLWHERRDDVHVAVGLVMWFCVVRAAQESAP